LKIKIVTDPFWGNWVQLKKQSKKIITINFKVFVIITIRKIKDFKMNKTIIIKIAATVTVLFSLLSIVEGCQVLLGATQQEYIVFTPLLIYNVIMGIVGLFVGVLIWVNHKKALTLTSIVTVIHLIVLIIVAVIFISDGPVSMHSVQAMIIRSVVWLAITFVTWKTNQSNEINT